MAFKANGGTNDCCNIGDRIPALGYYANETPERLHFASAIGTNGNYWTRENDYQTTIQINKKYKFVFEQKYVNQKV